jgi:hypothetical protein
MQVPVAADEWQLSWTAETLQARELLRHLRVNSRADLEQHNTAPLAVPLTLSVEAQALDVSLLGTSDTAAADDLEHLGSLQCIGLKVCIASCFPLLERPTHVREALVHTCTTS